MAAASIANMRAIITFRFCDRSEKALSWDRDVVAVRGFERQMRSLAHTPSGWRRIQLWEKDAAPIPTTLPSVVVQQFIVTIT